MFSNFNSSYSSGNRLHSAFKLVSFKRLTPFSPNFVPFSQEEVMKTGIYDLPKEKYEINS